MNDRIKAMTERLIGFKQGEMVSLMIHLGIRLGLYEVMANRGMMSVKELAEETGLHERWLLEWLRGQAAAGMFNYEGETRFELSATTAEIMCDKQSTSYLAGFFIAPLSPAIIDRIADAFRTGLGMTWDDHGSVGAHFVSQSNFPQHQRLASHVLPLMQGVIEKLEEGARVVDVGCGSGAALIALAQQFPRSKYLGIDPSTIAIETARKDAAMARLNNLEFVIMPGEELTGEKIYDFVMVLDCMHDITRPEKTMTAIHRAIKNDGIWLIKDIRSESTLEGNLESPIAAMMYGISVAYCMSSAMSEPGGAGLGTLGFGAEKARKMTQSAGFRHFRELDYDDDPFNAYYEVRI